MGIVACYIGQDVEKTIKLSIDSIYDCVDEIIFVDGGSRDKTIEYLRGYNKVTIIQRTFEKEHKGAIGRARNAYLKHIQETHLNDWCLVLDPDEVCDENIVVLKKCIKLAKQEKVNDCSFNIKMRHLVYNLSTEDATEKEHFAPRRFFKITKSLYYPETEHAVLQSKEKDFPTYKCRSTTIWHLAYAMNMFNLHKRYQNHLAKSEIHTPLYLHGWYIAHALGEYPTQKFDVFELPSVLKKAFDIDDKFYFRNRVDIQINHFIDAFNWKHFFDLKHKKVLLCGCGAGQRLFTLQSYEVDAEGFDISEWIVKNSPYNFKLKKDSLFVDSVLEGNNVSPMYHLVVAYDLLEHLTEKEVSIALSNMYRWTNKYALFSIPFVGDPNLENDSTHKTKQLKDWWEKQIKKAGFKILETPKYFYAPHQIIICEV
jgi:glycosyltransferase involved in cell wall biosynthesis